MSQIFINEIFQNFGDSKKGLTKGLLTSISFEQGITPETTRENFEYDCL